ncbi:MAG: DDE-type integrase/transposase/recombinase [Bacillota bacterium]
MTVPPAFVMILGSSRVKYVEFASRCDLNSLQRCIVNAFSYFGGVPKEVLTDNMKTVVVGRQAGKPIWNTRFEDFAADIGFIPKVCRPRQPKTKGKVERLVHYVKNNFLPARKFEDLSEHGSIILTSNKYFSDWGELLNDTVIATALLNPAFR